MLNRGHETAGNETTVGHSPGQRSNWKELITEQRDEPFQIVYNPVIETRHEHVRCMGARGCTSFKRVRDGGEGESWWGRGGERGGEGEKNPYQKRG